MLARAGFQHFSRRFSKVLVGEWQNGQEKGSYTGNITIYKVQTKRKMRESAYLTKRKHQRDVPQTSTTNMSSQLS